MILKQKQLPPLYTTVTTWNKLNMYATTMITKIKKFISDGDIFFIVQTKIIQQCVQTMTTWSFFITWNGILSLFPLNKYRQISFYMISFCMISL